MLHLQSFLFQIVYSFKRLNVEKNIVIHFEVQWSSSTIIIILVPTLNYSKFFLWNANLFSYFFKMISPHHTEIFALCLAHWRFVWFSIWKFDTQSLLYIPPQTCCILWISIRYNWLWEVHGDTCMMFMVMSSHFKFGTRFGWSSPTSYLLTYHVTGYALRNMFLHSFLPIGVF